MKNSALGHAYVFDDPKEANEFCNYVNAKHQISYKDVIGNVPITIGNGKYF